MNQAVALSDTTAISENNDALQVVPAIVTFNDFKAFTKKATVAEVFTKSFELIQKTMVPALKDEVRNEGSNSYIVKSYYLQDKNAFKNNQGLCAVIRCKNDEAQTPYSLDVIGGIGSVDNPAPPPKTTEMFNTLHAYYNDKNEQKHQFGNNKADTTIQWAKTFRLSEKQAAPSQS